MIKVITYKGKQVVQTNGGAQDYIRHEGRIYSINGGYFMEPRTNDWQRWEITEQNHDKSREREVLDWFAANPEA
jgi:hypothetical protein